MLSTHGQKVMNSTMASTFIPNVSPTFKLTAPQDNSILLTSLYQTPQAKLNSRKRNSNSIDIAKKQYKLDLNFDHNILRAMASADKEQEALKDNSSLNHGFKRMSAGMKILGNYQGNMNELVYTVKEHIKPFTTKKIPEKLRNTVAAQNKWIINDRGR